VLTGTVEPEPYGIAVAKNSPDLIRYVNGVLEQIRGDGIWETIYNQWLEPTLGAAQPPPAQYAD
jgi:polar amino acid transport system substrate-binding protein